MPGISDSAKTRTPDRVPSGLEKERSDDKRTYEKWEIKTA